MKRTLALLLATLSTSVFATIPNYSAPEILARANITDGYNLPAMSFLSNTSPVINNRGDVSFKLMAFDGQNNQGLWLKRGADEHGEIAYTAPDSRFVTDPSINDAGVLAFNLYDDGVTDGIFTLNADSKKVDQVLKPADDMMYYTYAQVLTNGKIYFRGTDQDNARTFYQYDGSSLKKIITEGTTTFGQKSSYLFKPYMNDGGAMTFKRRLGEVGDWDERNPDEILLIKPNGSSYDSIIVAKDKDSDSASVFKGFYNTSTVSRANHVAFTAYLEDNTKVIILYKDGVSKNIVSEKADGISEIELFAPKVNELGQVAFRAKDAQGKRGIYIADTSGVKRIVGEGDEIQTDLGMGRILSNPNYPGFGGDVDMNDHGEIVFYCLLVGAKDNQQEWGSAVFKISPLK